MMIDETHEETDFFNQDFTTVTRWEVLCARLEEIIHEWKLPYKNSSGDRLAVNQLSVCEWDTKEELITYDGTELKLTLYSAKISNDEEKSEGEMTDSMASVSIETETNSLFKQCQGVTKIRCQTFIDLISLENNWCILDEKSNASIHPLARWYGLREFMVLAPVGSTAISENLRRMLLSSIQVTIGETMCEVPIFVQALKPQQHVYSGLLSTSDIQCVIV